MLKAYTSFHNKSEFKVFQYFGNVKQNLTVVDDFANVLKVINHSRLWDAKLAWYSPIATWWIYLYDLEHSQGNHVFRLTWPYLIVIVLATRAKFFEPSGYWTEINCTFTFCTTNIFGCFHCIITQFELIKLSFQIRLHSTFILEVFKSHMELNNAQHVSVLTSTILQTTVSTFQVTYMS